MLLKELYLLSILTVLIVLTYAMYRAHVNFNAVVVLIPGSA